MKKYEVLIETIIVVIVIIVLVIVKGIPEIKSNIGSSEHITTSSEIDRLIDIKIDNNLFGYELSKDNKVINIIFYNETSLILYNKNIEKKTLSKAISQSIKILTDRKKISNNSKIIVTKYDKDSNSYREYFNMKYSSYNEKTSSYEELKTIYRLEAQGKEEILRSLDQQSKNYVLSLKNDNISEYTDYVYKKLLIYQSKNNIKNESKDNHSLNIQSIGVDELSIYPTSNSYYYIEDSKVYAYIELPVNNIDIGYCYRGSLNDYRKGNC